MDSMICPGLAELRFWRNASDAAVMGAAAASVDGSASIRAHDASGEQRRESRCSQGFRFIAGPDSFLGATAGSPRHIPSTCDDRTFSSPVWGG